MTYHPWHSIPDGWNVRYSSLPGRIWGATDPRHRIIWLDTALTQTQRRCTLAHELVHVELGHDGHQPASVERRVALIAALRLVTDADLTAALAWTQDRHQLADLLWVDLPTLDIRLGA